ncbi:hypothetical protein P5673_011587 [Acropora cervicornis]|uniref:Uncharacterized protein n=1 Tax=Acropora cervicornis TaxID=6130 RepID=A0AAD9QPE0_ACRCE|nr:hypothetical protein P5673_011587 [Acropora cervicornis]
MFAIPKIYSYPLAEALLLFSKEITPAYQTTGTTQWTVKDLYSAFSEIKKSKLRSHIKPQAQHDVDIELDKKVNARQVSLTSTSRIHLQIDFIYKDRFVLEANLGSTCQLISIFGHFWPMRVRVCLNFAKDRIRLASERKVDVLCIGKSAEGVTELLTFISKT